MIRDRKSTRLNSSHSQISYAVFCLKKKKQRQADDKPRRHHNQHARVTTRGGRPLRPVPSAGQAWNWRPPPASARGSLFFNDTATTEIYTLSLHDALPI